MVFSSVTRDHTIIPELIPDALHWLVLDKVVHTSYRRFKLQNMLFNIKPKSSCWTLCVSVFQLPPGSSRHPGKRRKSRSEWNSRYSRSTGPGCCKRREGWMCDGEVWRAVETQLQAMCLELSQLRHWPGQDYSKIHNDDYWFTSNMHVQKTCAFLL